MGISLVSQKFYDKFNTSFDSFTANAGDETTCVFTFQEDTVIISSVNNVINHNSLIKTFTLQGGSFIKEGFKVGDTIKFAWFQNDVVGLEYTLSIVTLTDTQLVYNGNAGIHLGNVPTNQTYVLYRTQTNSKFEFSLNFINNSNTTNTPVLSSLIDGETSKFSSSFDFSTASIGQVIQLTQVGKKSGCFDIKNVSLIRKNNINRIKNYNNFSTKVWELNFTVVNPFLLLESKFKGANCLKLVSLFRFAYLSTDSNFTELYYNLDSNTGYLDEAYNNDVPKTNLNTISMPTLYYNYITEPTANMFSFQFTETNFNTNHGFVIGASYLTLRSYNQNKKDSQSTLLFCNQEYYSYGNTATPIISNGLFTIKVVSRSQIVSGADIIVDVNCLIYFNQSAITFFNSLADSDRTFCIWLQAGNNNITLHKDVLEFKQPVGKPFTEYGKYLTAENNNTSYDNVTLTPISSRFFTSSGGADINIEDNVSFIMDLDIEQVDTNSFVRASIISSILSTGEEFTLDSVEFDISKQDWNFWKDQVINRPFNLSNASVKLKSFLKYKASLNFGNTKQLRLAYTFLVDWRYWLTQLNATQRFSSVNQDNKKWSNYSRNNLGSQTYIKIEISRNGVLDYNLTPLDLYDYDQTLSFTSSIQLLDTQTNNPISSIVIGKPIKIIATHVKNAGVFAFNGWGDITIEQSESSPRWNISTIVDWQSGTKNPLIPITGTTATILSPAGNTRTIECILDTSKLSGDKFCISSKIADETFVSPVQNQKITENNIDKITEDNQDKITE